MYIKNIADTAGLPADSRERTTPSNDVEINDNPERPEWLKIWIDIAEQDRKFLAG